MSSTVYVSCCKTKTPKQNISLQDVVIWKLTLRLKYVVRANKSYLALLESMHDAEND